MGDGAPLNAVKLVTDDSGKVLGVEDLERGQSIPIEQTSESSEFVCEEGQFAPYIANVGGSRWGSIGDAIGRMADGIKEAVEPVVEGAIGILEGAKEFCATLIQKVKEEAVAQNMKKGAEECVIKKEQSANKETGKKSDAITNEGVTCLTTSDNSGSKQVAIKNNGEYLSRNDEGEDGRAGREAIHAEARRNLGVDAATGEIEKATAKTVMVSPNSAVADDGSVADVGDKKIEQAIRDKAEQAEKGEVEKTEEKIALEVADANALQEKVDNGKASAGELRSKGPAERDDGPALDVNSAVAQDESTHDTIVAGYSGEHWVPFDPSPFVSNDRGPPANGFDPPVLVGQRMEYLFPAIVQNFIGCFTYLQFQRNAHENNANPFSHTQAVAGEKGEQVWPAGKKEGGDNHSGHGGSSDQGQDKKREEESA